MSALGRVVRAGVGRRRVQTAVMVLTTLITVASSILAGGLLIASNAPFDHAFAKQHGAELAAQFDGSKATVAQISATARAAGVTAAAGPFLTLSMNPQAASDVAFVPAGADLPRMTLVGRGEGGPVDDATMVSGKWPTGPGQIVLDTGYIQPEVGAKLQFPDLPGKPTLTVVGIARSVSQTADAWVTPEQALALSTPGATPTYQMLYRFAHADTAAQISADRSAIVEAAPSSAFSGAQSYLSIKQVETTNTGAFVPFIAAFGVIGLVMSVLIIGTVVSGSVGAATRRIGVLKSLGFTPSQVVRAYVAQALIPAAIGTGLGIVVGNVLAIPVLNGAENTYGTASLSMPLWVDVVVPTLALLLVALAAVVPALRAGRMHAAEAIAVGRTPRAGRARPIQRWAARLPLPRPLTLGLANPFARPSRSAALAAAVVFGAASITFAVGLALSLNGVQVGRDLDTAGAVEVETGMPQGKSGGPVLKAPGPRGQTPAKPADPAAVAAAIRAQPGTKSFYGTVGTELSVSGITGSTRVIGYEGDSSWATHQMISGSWLTGAGQAVVSPRFLTAAGVKVGDTITVSKAGQTISLRIVGQVFELSGDGMDLFTEVSSLAPLGVGLQGVTYKVDPDPGTNLTFYLSGLNTALQPIGASAGASFTSHSDVIAAMDALVALLTLMMVVVAALAVLNTVVLETRERVHDLGVFKALGMSPRQTITSVITSASAIGLMAGLIGVPVGIAVHSYVVPIMGHVAGTRLPGVDLDVYHLPELVLLVLGGLAIAVAGALLPAGWAARTSTATALRTE